MSGIESAQHALVVITDDGRPGEQYAALQVFLGHRPAGWLPTWSVDGDEVDAAITEANMECQPMGVVVEWGQPHYSKWVNQSISSLVARPADGGV